MNLLKEKLIGHRRMRFIFIAVTCLVLFVPPVSAQSAQSVNAGEITPAGLLGAAVTIGAVMVGGIFGLVKPYVDNKLAEAKTERDAESTQIENTKDLIQAINTLGTSIARVLDDQSEERKDQITQRAIVATSQKDMTTVLGGMLKRMDDFETQDGAAKRERAIQANSDKNAEAINAHVDRLVEDTQTSLKKHMTAEVDELEKKVNEAIQTLTTLRTDVTAMAETIHEMPTITSIREVLSEQLGSMDERIDEAIQQFLSVKKGDTNRNLNPQVALDAERARGIANGDTTAQVDKKE